MDRVEGSTEEENDVEIEPGQRVQLGRIDPDCVGDARQDVASD